VLLLHDGNSALAPDGRPVVLAVLPRLLQALRGQRLRSVPLNEAFKGGEAVCPLDKVAA
jgi:polysaccharide deacetylase